MSSAVAGFSPARLALIDRVLKERYVDTGRLPGVMIEIWRHGQRAHLGMSGDADRETRRPMHEDAIFRIHSLSKPIIGVALLTLVEEYKLDLSDEVARYFPALADLGVYTGGGPGAWTTRPASRRMTILDVALHTAGLVGWADSPVARHAREIRLGHPDTAGGFAGFVAQLATLPLESSPGERWNYSDGPIILGAIIESVSGTRLGEFLRRRIFEPLGMHDTGFVVAPEKLARLARLYGAASDRSLYVHEENNRNLAQPRLESGSGGLVSTTHDYLRFCRMILGRGSLDGVQILSPKTVAMLSTNFLPGGRDVVQMSSDAPSFQGSSDDGLGISIGFDTTIDVALRRMPATLGDISWSGAANQHFWIDPKEDLAVVFMSQVLDFDDFFTTQRLLRTLVYSAFTHSDVPV